MHSRQVDDAAASVHWLAISECRQLPSEAILGFGCGMPEGLSEPPYAMSRWPRTFPDDPSEFDVKVDSDASNRQSERQALEPACLAVTQAGLGRAGASMVRCFVGTLG